MKEKGLKSKDKTEIVKYNKKMSKSKWLTVGVAIAFLLTGFSTSMATTTITNSGISIDNEGSITTEWINASDSDGLKLYDDGGSGGVFINDGGRTVISTNNAVGWDIGYQCVIRGSNEKTLLLETFGNDAWKGAYLAFVRGNGTAVSPTAIGRGSRIFAITANGYNVTNELSNAGNILFIANGSSGAVGQYIGGKYQFTVIDEADGGNEIIFYYADNSKTGGAYLDVDGTIHADATLDVSDERVKDFLFQLPVSAVKRFCSDVQVWMFNWKEYEVDETTGLEVGETTTLKGCGIPAQSLFNYAKDNFGEQYARAFVSVGDDYTTWSVNYNAVSMVFARYTQILQDELDSLDARITALENP